MTTQELKQELNETFRIIEDAIADFTVKSGFVLHVNIHNEKDANKETVYKCSGYLTDNVE